ncbi:hypothetical protein P152DRAFT_456700 [Eremomyces bilateralis CBS 781.70]|uniref:Uncharacterized protein n=1 Tax=Eremomyces bilateralis CBS 781.70 TaxID=1392243 RepID=A0A6G1G8M2_9PEZI|nr:uncharacterized protein P152DRAFT_456700 [Eremomyces bilateralis CBS 781.70]KAF1814445.1 hypothetical protein P152DRAFT_456700 [Eremomyces bilateralis CBS 781.70]
MKTSTILTTLFASVALAATPEQCSQYCQPICPLDLIYSCHCANENAAKCHEQCDGPKPEIKVCPPLPVPPVEGPTPSKPGCTCETIACPLIFPPPCSCVEARVKCWEKCGGTEPVREPCTDLNRDPSPQAQCGTRGAPGCADNEECVKRPGASCGPEVDCGGICVTRSRPTRTRRPSPKPTSTSPTSEPTARETLAQQYCGGFAFPPNPKCPEGQVCQLPPDSPCFDGRAVEYDALTSPLCCPC